MKILDHFKSNSLIKQIFLMLIIVFVIFFLVYNSLKIYTKHNRYTEVPNLVGKNLDEAISILDDNKLITVEPSPSSELHQEEKHYDQKIPHHPERTN